MDDPESSDYNNFTQPSPSAHRLPTLNGTHALFDAIARHKPISTGIQNLDIVLSTNDTTISTSGGITPGIVTEIYGPPGCGKTQMGMQLAANVLKHDATAEVIWIDAFSTVPVTRLEHFVNPTSNHSSQSNEEDEKASQLLDRFDHKQIPDLTRLLALLMQPPQQFLSSQTQLLVIDDLSNAIMTGLPQGELSTSSVSATPGHLSREDIISRSIANRRAAMLGAISAGLARLAVSNNVAVAVLNKATSGRRSGDRNATLRSMLNTPQWNENIATRIVLYRDFWPQNLQGSKILECSQTDSWRDYPLRIAEVEKLGGREIHSRGVKFMILQHGLQAVEVKLDRDTNHVVTLPDPSTPPEETNEEAMNNLDLVDAGEVLDEGLQMPEDVPAASSPTPPETHRPKRKLDEVADSEDEEDLLARSQSIPEAIITNAKGEQFRKNPANDDDEMLLT